MISGVVWFVILSVFEKPESSPTARSNASPTDGTCVSIVILTPGENSEIFPVRSRLFTKTAYVFNEWDSALSSGTVKLTEFVEIAALSILTSFTNKIKVSVVALAVDKSVIVKVGVVSLVRLSLSDTPVSESLSKSTKLSTPRVVAVLSNVTELPSFVAATAVPSFAAKSEKAILNVIAPSSSLSCMVYVAVH